jgi:hypothetical protein
MISPSGLTGALFMAACLVDAGIFAVVGGLAWLAFYLWRHIDIVWIP